MLSVGAAEVVDAMEKAGLWMASLAEFSSGSLADFRRSGEPSFDGSVRIFGTSPIARCPVNFADICSETRQVEVTTGHRWAIVARHEEGT